MTEEDKEDELIHRVFVKPKKKKEKKRNELWSDHSKARQKKKKDTEIRKESLLTVTT